MRLRDDSARWWLLTRTIATTRDRQRAERSRFMWGVDDADASLYRLRVIGLLRLKVWLIEGKRT